MHERAFGSFSRSLTLPDGVDPEAVEAHFDRGVLEIRIPKPEQKKLRQVQIKLGTGRAQEPVRLEATPSSDLTTNSRQPEPALA